LSCGSTIAAPSCGVGISICRRPRRERSACTKPAKSPFRMKERVVTSCRSSLLRPGSVIARIRQVSLRPSWFASESFRIVHVLPTATTAPRGGRSIILSANVPGGASRERSVERYFQLASGGFRRLNLSWCDACRNKSRARRARSKRRRQDRRETGQILTRAALSHGGRLMASASDVREARIRHLITADSSYAQSDSVATRSNVALEAVIVPSDPPAVAGGT
jgi:hypothetical protein